MIKDIIGNNIVVFFVIFMGIILSVVEGSEIQYILDPDQSINLNRQVLSSVVYSGPMADYEALDGRGIDSGLEVADRLQRCMNDDPEFWCYDCSSGHQSWYGVTAFPPDWLKLNDTSWWECLEDNCFKVIAVLYTWPSGYTQFELSIEHLISLGGFGVGDLPRTWLKEIGHECACAHDPSLNYDCPVDFESPQCQKYAWCIQAATVENFVY
ncbi:MAG: hypothetical protein GY782_08625 [Gammaproteobacteria bacterium]|nr:hypothetical protein [Gammaproteobacteria bacterium]